jgi:hypothetical protein
MKIPGIKGHFVFHKTSKNLIHKKQATLYIRRGSYYVDYCDRIVKVFDEKPWFSSDGKTWSCACNFTDLRGRQNWSTLGLSREDFIRFATKKEIFEFNQHQKLIK